MTTLRPHTHCIRGKSGITRPAPKCGRNFAVLLFALTWLLSPTRTAAGDTADKPILLVIETAQTDADRTREQAFLEELQLALDRYRVAATGNDPSDGMHPFSEMSLQSQIQQVRGLAAPHHAAAVVWLTEDARRNITLLHLAALSPGRALIRVVETPNGPNAEVNLAMAVNELVGQAYLFDAQNPAAAVEASVISAAGQEMPPTATAPKDNTTPCPAPDLRGSFVLETFGRTGIAGTQGPRLTLGGGLGIQRHFSRNLFVGGGLQLIAGPFEDRDARQIENMSLAPYLSGGILRPWRRIRIGAGLFISIPWQQTIITFPDTGEHVYRNWNMRYAVRFTVQIPLGRWLALALSPNMGIWLNQKRYFAISSNRDIVRNPRLDVGLNIGLVINN